MENTNKIYIGKGTQVKNYDMYNVVVNLSKAEAHIFEHNGEKFIKFTLSKTKQPDSFGKTHSAFIMPMVAKQAPATAGSDKTKKSRKAKPEVKEPLEVSFNNH